MKQNRPDEAIALYRQAVKDSPNSDSTWYALGTALEAKHNYEEAIKAYKKSLTLNPGNSAYRAHLNEATSFFRGLTLNRQGRYSEAIMSYREALKFGPDSAFLWMALGTAEQQNRQLDDAITSLEKAASLEPTNGEYRKLAAFARDMKNEQPLPFDSTAWKNAKDLSWTRFQMVRDLVNSPALRHKTKQEVIAILGPPDESNPAYITYSANQPIYSSHGNSLRLELAFAKDRLTKARLTNQVGFMRRPLLEIHAWANAPFLSADDALAGSKAARTRRRKLELLDLALKMDPKLAMAHMEKALALPPGDPTSMNELEIFDSLETSAWLKGHAWSNLGYRLAQSRMYSQAISAYSKAAKYSPDTSNYGWLAYCYLRSGDNVRAIDLYTKLINGDKDVRSISRNKGERGEAFFAMGRYDDALSDYNAAIAVEPRQQTLLHRAKVYEILGEREAAQQDKAHAAELKRTDKASTAKRQEPPQRAVR